MKTVADQKMMLKFLSEKEAKRKVELKKKFVLAWKDFEILCEHIIKNYKPEKIYQWGSLLHESHFSEISDIDIAIQGNISPAEYFQLLAEADSMSHFPVDIVQLDTIMPVHREKIRNKGRLVYERKT